MSPQKRPPRSGIYENSAALEKLKEASRWLDDVIGKLLFEHVRDAIKSVRSVKGFPRYDPYLYESLMADVSRSLDRCLAYRRECLDLERQAVNRALEYQLFQTMADHSDELNQQLTDTQALDAAKSGQADAAAALSGSPAPWPALAPGYSGSANAAEKSIEIQNKKKETLKEMVTAQRTYQEQLQLRYTTPGHSMNYAERRDRVIRLITQDVAIAYEKAVAASAGMAMQIGVKSVETEFPSITDVDLHDADFLDNFLFWTREIFKLYELYTNDEVTFDVMLPLGEPFYVGGSSPEDVSHSLVPGGLAAFQTVLKSTDANNGVFEVNLLSAIHVLEYWTTSPDSHLRVRGIGVFAGTGKTQQSLNNQTTSWRVYIELPDQPDPLSASNGATQDVLPPGRYIKRPPIIFGRVTPYSVGAPSTLNAGDEVWNAYLTGTTRITVGVALEGDSSITPERRKWEELKDLVLHLRLVGNMKVVVPPPKRDR